MITKETAIEAIGDAIEKSKKINNAEDFEIWRNTTIGTLHRVVPHNKTIFTHLKSIPARTLTGILISTSPQSATNLLSSLIDDIKRFGLEKPPKPRPKKNSAINFNLNQSQNTNVSINIEFVIDAIKDELKGAQVKELKEILASDAEPEAKKKSFVEKVKSFGSDVASNILANIVTNPSVYEKMGGLF